MHDLQMAVLFGFTAIESLVNHAIEMLDEDFKLTRRGKVLPKSRLVRELGVDDKLKRVIPRCEGGKTIAGTEIWERYRGLKFLRDELLHVKQRGMEPDPRKLTAYDRLLVGEADTCAEDARAVIEGAWPSFLPDHVLEALG